MEDKKKVCLQSFSSPVTGEFTSTPIILGMRALRATFANITWVGNEVALERLRPSNEAAASAQFGCALLPVCVGQQRYCTTTNFKSICLDVSYDSRTNTCVDPVCSAYALMAVDEESKTCVWSIWGSISSHGFDSVYSCLVSVPYVFGMLVVLLSAGDILSQRLYRICVRLAAQKSQSSRS